MNSFIDDTDKILDMLLLSKAEFLSSYSYLTEVEYENTKNAILHFCKTRKKLSDDLNSNLKEE